MLVLPDNDVVGAAMVLRHILHSKDWAEYTALVGVQFTDFEEMGLPRNAPDRVVWQACQSAGAVLITANRAGNGDSLDDTIRQLSGPTSLPVVTIADPQRLLREPSYAEAAAIQLLDFLDRIDSLRGAGRLFIP